MTDDCSRQIRQILRFLAFLLVAKVTITVVLTFGDYFPPDFDEAVFLNGRKHYFWSGYHLAFYGHIVSGPVSLFLGMLLLSERFRRRMPGWHRKLGRVQVVCILLLVTPTGLWMSFYSETGAVAGTGFGVLALATGITALAGWRAALRRCFVLHRLWMQRCYLLLCSAVVLRLTAGLATVTETGGDWTYQMAAWTSWVVPLAAFEICRVRATRPSMRNENSETSVAQNT